MVVLLLCDTANAVEKVQRRDKILDPPLPANPLAVFAQRPAGDGGKVLLDLFGCHRRDAGFAGHASLAAKFACRCCRHQGFLLWFAGLSIRSRRLAARTAMVCSMSLRSIRRPRKADRSTGGPKMSWTRDGNGQSHAVKMSSVCGPPRIAAGTTGAPLRRAR